jgi:cell division transport system permease protein
LIAYLTRHIQVFFATLGQLARSPINSLTTILIIALTLLLPSILYVFLKSADQVSENWQGRPQISIFLEQELNQAEAHAIFQEVELNPQIAVAELIKPEAALVEFKALSGLDKELNFLDHNPLPTSIVVMPNREIASDPELRSLVTQFEKIDGIDQIKLDLAWTNRFNSVLALLKRVTALLAIIIACGLVLVISNTIRLIILNKRDEIEITKLVGGSNTFIRRPFLYYGFLVGFIGGCLSLGLLALFFLALNGPIEQLTQLYNSQNPIYSLNLKDSAILITIGACIGWLAARLSLAKHLHAIRPQ